MKKKIERVAVLGSGVMGAKIAAHFANAGIPSFLLDIVPKELNQEEKQKGLSLSSQQVRNRLAKEGLEEAKKAKPAAFFSPELSDLITVGNFEDNIEWIKQSDWIIEVVVERLDIKRQVFKMVDQVRNKETIVTSNTSGIPISSIAEGLSDDFQRHFCGTHFFNPPRYMKLLEIIPASKTLPEVTEFLSEFCERRLGKGIVYCKDTPNFIANRVGVFSMLYAVKSMLEDGFTIEEVDLLSGPVTGKPKSAVFRTADLVGLDTLAHVANNLYDAVPDDEMREVFRLPDFIKEMIKNKWLGDKTRQGFYKTTKLSDGQKEILALDYNTMQYRPSQRPKFPSVDLNKSTEDIKQRIKALTFTNDRAGKFIWKNLSSILLYSANRVPEITEDIVNIDNAMKWGFNWELGPFETWDAIGLEPSLRRMKEDGHPVPELVENLLSTGHNSFYTALNGRKFFFDWHTCKPKAEPAKPGIILLPSLKDQNKEIKKNSGASLIDLGDGVACLEFHSKMNTIGEDILQMIQSSLNEVAKNFQGLVIGNQAQNFSVGANLMLILMQAQDENWDELDLAVRLFQKVTMGIKYSERPVVVAPYSMTFGGGCEISLSAPKIHSAAELYMGLVELGVGLIPAGGGTKEMLLRNISHIPLDSTADLFPFVKRAFETIGMAKVSTSAKDAKNLGYLREDDSYSISQDYLIADAKKAVLALSEAGYAKPAPLKKIPVLGEPALANLKIGIHLMKEAGYISEYDAHIGGKLANILCGGPLSSKAFVSEQYLLDLEREAFLSLLGERKTQERIKYMLEKGKPLRN